MSSTSAMRRRARRLNSVDLPTLGRPTMATRGFIDGFLLVTQLLEALGPLAPPGLHAHPEREVHVRPQEPLDGLARVRTDRLQHLSLLANDDGLLAVPLHVDGAGHPDEARALPRRRARQRLALGLVEEVHHHRRGVGNLLVAVAQ